MKRKKIILFSLIIVTCILILIGSYKENYNLEIQPPSKTWSKEVSIGTATTKNAPVILKEENRIIVAYENNKNLNIVATNTIGEVLQTKEYEVNEELINNVLLTKSVDGYILMLNSIVDEEGYLLKIYVDKDLNEVNRENIKGIKSTYQLDNDNIIVAYNDRLEIINTLEDSAVSIPVKTIDMLSACKNKEGFLICYMEDNSFIKAFTFNEDKVSEPILVKEIAKNNRVIYKNMSCSSDGENGYTMFEQYVKGELHSCRLFEFPIAGGEVKESKPRINESNALINAIGTYSDEEGGKFYTIVDNSYGKKESRRGIAAFVVKDGKINKVEPVTRTRGVCINPYINENYISYLSFRDEDLYDVVIASTDEEFKAVNNLPRDSEKKSAITYTIEGLMNSFAYIIVVGFPWIAIGLVLSGVVTFLDYKLSHKKKKIAYLIVAALTTCAKNFVIIKMFYVKYAYMLPSAIAPVYIGVIICTLIAVITYSYGYYSYTGEFEGIFISKFAFSLLIDALLTLMIYAPLIV
ncbi:hypothetical protein [Clostridium sp.]|uniref:hypothetical protein n=1 Tax=Clostridium sp. TaxID=1506 RepID=UPI003464BAD9